jgi:hypothetical protein
MVRTRVAALAGVLALAAGLTAGLGAATTASAAAASTTAATSAELQNFAANVETLGETRFPDTFAGAALTSAGVVIVYSTNTRDAALSSAMAKLNTGNYPLGYIAARFSYSKLDALNSALAAAQAELQKDGVELFMSEPNAATGAVDVTLLRPTSADFARLNSSGVISPAPGRLTTANYSRAASAVISSIAGSGYAVEPAWQSQPATTTTPNSSDSAAGRFNGTAPFSGGDYIKGSNGLNCTGGFSVEGSKSHNPFMLTAGHCGRTTWSTPAQVMGRTSSLYWRNPARDDFQTIRVGSARGNVNGNTAEYSVVGQVVPARGSLLTLDGSITGEVHGIKVLSNNATIYNIKGPGGVKFTASHLVTAAGPCTGGDSGGPMYVRVPAPLQVRAVGTIVAYYGLPSGGFACAGERIGYELSASNTSLILDARVVR